MALKRLKTKQSKRQPARLKYKIQAKVREHTRKVRKEARKTKGKTGRTKMIQIPNICPFKEEILKDIEIAKQRKEEERLAQHERWRIEREEKKRETLEALVASAEARDAVHTEIAENEPEIKKYNLAEPKELSLKAYFKEFKKVIEAADVVLEVVDARDPLGTRCAEVAQAVRSAPGNKRLVLVLNKADLVPRENLDKWLKYLRKFGPTTVFKASTQQQKRSLGRRKYKQMKSSSAMQSAPCIGADLLMSMLANYCRSNGIKTSIRVGVVGIPNVGKSSIINSLKRGRACIVGSTPGVTRSMQEVEIDSKIKLLDSPGIVFTHAKSDPYNTYVLKNAQRVTNIRDPYSAAKAVLQRASKSFFCKLYNVSEYDTPEEFFARLSQSMGRIRKGGVPDMLLAARTVLMDWNSGKIKYCTHPPEESSDTNIHLSATIVNSNAREFEIENFEEMEAEFLNKFDTKFDDIMEITSTGPVNINIDKEDVTELTYLIDGNTQIIDGHVDEMKDEDAEEDKPKFGKKRMLIDSKKKKTDPAMSLEGNLMLNKQMKDDVKRLKKLKNKNERKISNVTDVLEGFSFDGKKKEDQDYDFEEDLVMKE